MASRSVSGGAGGPATASTAEAAADQKPNHCDVQLAAAKPLGQPGHPDANLPAGRQQPDDAAEHERQSERRRHSDAVDARLRNAHTSDAEALDDAARARAVARGAGRPGGAGAVREDVQTEADKARVHAGRRWPGDGQTVRKRFFTNDHITLRGAQLELQEHVQAEAAAAEVARGRRQ